MRWRQQVRHWPFGGAYLLCSERPRKVCNRNIKYIKEHEKKRRRRSLICQVGIQMLLFCETGCPLNIGLQQLNGEFRHGIRFRPIRRHVQSKTLKLNLMEPECDSAQEIPLQYGCPSAKYDDEKSRTWNWKCNKTWIAHWKCYRNRNVVWTPVVSCCNTVHSAGLGFYCLWFYL